ncbi:helix-turn-helix domain-containing protein, partial [Patescibacteria group bacterium]
MQELLTLNQASKMLGVKPETLRKWDNLGRLKAIRIGSRQDRRYKKEQILNILGQNNTDKYEIQEMDGSLHIFFGYIDGFINGLKNNFGKSISKHITITHNGHMKIGYPAEELLGLGKFLTKKLIKNSKIINKTINEFNFYFKETERLIKLAEKNNVTKKELLELFIQSEKIYEAGMSWSMIVEPLDIYLIKQIKNNLDIPSEKFTDIFGTLTSPLEE